MSTPPVNYAAPAFFDDAVGHVYESRNLTEAARADMVAAMGHVEWAGPAARAYGESVESLSRKILHLEAELHQAAVAMNQMADLWGAEGL